MPKPPVGRCVISVNIDLPSLATLARELYMRKDSAPTKSYIGSEAIRMAARALCAARKVAPITSTHEAINILETLDIEIPGRGKLSRRKALSFEEADDSLSKMADEFVSFIDEKQMLEKSSRHTLSKTEALRLSPEQINQYQGVVAGIFGQIGAAQLVIAKFEQIGQTPVPSQLVEIFGSSTAEGYRVVAERFGLALRMAPTAPPLPPLADGMTLGIEDGAAEGFHPFITASFDDKDEDIAEDNPEELAEDLTVITTSETGVTLFNGRPFADLSKDEKMALIKGGIIQPAGGFGGTGALATDITTDDITIEDN